MKTSARTGNCGRSWSVFWAACFSLLWGNAVAAEEDRVAPAEVERAVESAHAAIWTKFVGPNGLIRDYVGELPTPEDCVLGKPNAIGWWSPIENGPMFTGLYLPAVCQRALRSGSPADKEQARRLAEGLLLCASVSDVPGFIARGVGTDGKCHYPMGSDDQTHPWFYGLHAYVTSGLPDKGERQRIVDKMREVAAVLEATGWRCPCDGAFAREFRGGFQGHLFRDAVRYLYMLRAMHDVTGDEVWLQRYRLAAAERPEQSEKTRAEICAVGYPLDREAIPHIDDAQLWIYVGSQGSLARLAAMETDETLRKHYRVGLEVNASGALASIGAYQQFDNADTKVFGHANWREGYPEWFAQQTQADALRLSQTGDKVKLGARKGYEVRFMRNPLAAAAIVALAGGDSGRDEIGRAITHYDYAKLNMAEFFFAECAYYALPAAEDGAIAENGMDVLTLENQALRLEIQRKPVPLVDRLLHKSGDLAVVSSPEDYDLFQLVLNDVDGKSRTVSASAARRSGASLADIDGKRVVVMQWSDFSDADLTVRATACCSPDEPVTLWSIDVDNRSGKMLSLVRFPRLLARPQLEQPEDDFLVLPALPGVLIDNPAANWPVGQSVRLDYPGTLSAKFLSWQDRNAGVYLAGRDAASHLMALGVSKRSTGFQLWHEYTLAPSDGTGVWKSPYPVAIGVTQGTWHESADLYKRWAVKQPWCAKTLTQRDDIPEWWKAGPDVHVCSVRTYDEQRICDGSYYPQLLHHLQTYRQKIDGPVVAMLASWEQHRRWTAGDYFPVFDEPQARQVIAELRQQDFRPFFFLSGLYYTFENEGVSGSPIPSAADYRQHYVIDQATGEPRVFVLNESNPTRHWKRNSYEFCVGDPAAAEFFSGVVDRAHELGVDVLQMDQTTSGAGHACYSSDHEHEPGAGCYQTEGFHQLLRTMRSRGKQHTADFVLFHEEPHEQLIQYLDGFHVREYKEKWWYRGYPGAVGIPLFSYLYHEYAIGYGGDSAVLHPSRDRRMVRSHAVNLATGRTPGGSVWSTPQNMFDAHPDQITMLRNHCRLLRTRAREFLVLGKMLHPYELNVPKLTFQWTDGAGDSKKTETTEDPAILTSSWLSPAGKVGHLFVNISETVQPLAVEIDTRNAPQWTKCDIALFTSTDDLAFRPAWNSVTLPQPLSRQLQPLEVLFVEVSDLLTHAQE